MANGLGGISEDDNILKFNILRDGSVAIDLIAITGDNPDALGEIYDYDGGAGE